MSLTIKCFKCVVSAVDQILSILLTIELLSPLHLCSVFRDCIPQLRPSYALLHLKPSL